MREFGIIGSIKTPVNFIVHSLQEVNDGLAHGRYFFMDVACDGIALYRSEDSVIAPALAEDAARGALHGEEVFRGVDAERGRVSRWVQILHGT
ncbi:hypothetical protein J2X47_003508 [Sphingomonas sp. BE270]|jgi:hypothetical protein|uniref:hypothetical protein n=1 Tax=Sphingomonas sp. BE270 TaxID=2817726 RepID=UPI0028577DB7|nr:hypothetical protein [Sphingomonas sp. BE270]